MRNNQRQAHDIYLDGRVKKTPAVKAARPPANPFPQQGTKEDRAAWMRRRQQIKRRAARVANLVLARAARKGNE